MRINQNIAAFNAYRNLNQTQTRLSSSLEKLSSGFRINRAADDASGLVNSENLRSQIGGLKVATRNAQDAISMVQTAEGAQTEVHSILQRMRDLAVQSGNLGTNDVNALKANQAELNKLVDELDRIADETQFGTQKILNGDFGGDAVDVVDVEASITRAASDDGTAAFAEVHLTDASFADAAGRDVEITLSNSVNDVDVTVSFNYGASEAEAAQNLAAALNGLSAADKYALDISSVAVAAGGTSVEVTAVTTAGTEEYVVDSAELAATVEGGAVFQVGANKGQTVDVRIDGVSSGDLEVDGLNIGKVDEGTGDLTATADTIASAIEAIDKAIGTVSENRAELGAFQNRMESTIRNLSVAVENLSAAESRIRDTDMALEMVDFTRNQILSQAGTAMLAQANVIPQSVLSLLG